MPAHAQDPAPERAEDNAPDHAVDAAPTDDPEPVIVSRIDEKDRHDIRLQQIIDHLARESEGRPHADVVSALVDRIDSAGLEVMPQPWLDAVAAAAIEGNAYVVSRTSAALSDVPEPETTARQHNVT
jgi:hypothetical protein